MFPPLGKTGGCHPGVNVVTVTYPRGSSFEPVVGPGCHPPWKICGHNDSPEILASFNESVWGNLTRGRCSRSAGTDGNYIEDDWFRSERVLRRGQRRCDT